MPETALPSARVALASLRKNGNQFDSVPVAPQPLEGVIFQHPKDGERQAAADRRVLAQIGRFYAADTTLRQAIETAGCQAGSLQSAAELVAAMYSRSRMIWSISGFASVGFPCDALADRLEQLYLYLAAEHRRPVICDGGVGAGALGISGVLARQHKITSIGVIPMEGLESMAPRTYMFAYGDTYRQRQDIVGLLGDILVLAGGGLGATEEALVALEHGSGVLLLDDLDESLIPWRSEPKMVEAIANNQMIVCGSLDQIEPCAERLRVRAAQSARYLRSRRLRRIRGDFAA